MYHVEMRQFPHNFCRFNLSERELGELVLDAWAREQWLEFGERKWNPHEANLTILRGPRMELRELSMGRGWRNAQKRCEDVTEELVAGRRAELAAGSAAPGPAQDAPAPAPLSEREQALGLASDLLGLLGEDPRSLIGAWQLALERHPDRTPSECLALAEDLVRR
jgi:hypothetical protein